MAGKIIYYTKHIYLTDISTLGFLDFKSILLVEK